GAVVGRLGGVVLGLGAAVAAAAAFEEATAMGAGLQQAAAGRPGCGGGGGQQGYHGIYENNLDTIPGFTESGDTPFALLSSSPLSDEGTPDTTSLQVPEKDLGGNTRIYNGRIDIGAYEWNPVTAINSLEKNGFHLNIIPNPVQSDVSVTFKLDHPDWLTFYIFSSAGRLVWQSDELFCNAGVQNLLVTSHLSDKDTCKNGLYILRTRGKNIDHSTPFIFIR
ncbi:MAG: choice-of-anchor Q domain-containing protein, partial [Bacteroidota bacterium]